jgi:hypothetical protein
MKTPSWTVQRGKKTVRVNKKRNRKSRWGPGKVHWMIYSPEWKAYYKACRTPDNLLFILGGETDVGNVPRDEEISCRNCQKISWLNG